VEERSQGRVGRQKKYAWSSDDVAFLRKVKSNQPEVQPVVQEDARSAHIPEKGM
jgi:hypothetical protein